MAKKFFSSPLGTYLSENEIVHQTFFVNTPKKNGIVERKNGHLFDTVQTLLFTMRVPKYLWGEAMLIASYLINRMPTRVLNFKTPLNSLKLICLTSHLFNTLPPKVFGCTTFVNIHNHD